MSQQRWVIVSEEAGGTLLDLLSTKLPGWTRRRIKAALDRHCCFVNGRVERHAKTTLEAGSVVVFEEKEAHREWNIEPDRVLYEDDWLVVYDKPVGVESDDKTFWRVLHARWPQLQAVHRLDRDTTGAWLLAKDPGVKETLVEAFRAKKVTKHYYAVVDGEMAREHGVIQKPLRRISEKGRVLWGVGPGLSAETRWKCVFKGGGASVVECEPVTGRTHQIRVHMASIGHPILGDFQYHRQFRCRYAASRPLLHAASITFPHPMTRDLITVEAPQPRDVADAIAYVADRGGKPE